MRADTFDVMEYLWDQLAKSPDPDHATLTTADIDVLWHCGFVDTATHSLTQWRSAFDAHRGSEGTFVLSKVDFVAKEPFRFTGEIHVPFDALKINEGLYTQEGFQELLDDSISPSVRSDAAAFDAFLTDVKKRARQPNGLLKIDMPVKREIRRFIDDNPSPLRRLELIFDTMIRQQKWEFATTGALPVAVTPEQIARVEASTFSLLPDNPVEAKGKELKALQQLRSPAADDPTKPTTPLKQIRRSRKGMRG